ncbi:MAG: phosphatidylglycerophosphatase A [Woeseiaceae bacterium]|jgi:phosphatidylglycerophosphatase A|nr:phosphatidylglycerophosphatase A [Woeseiaceae bacterium]|tara:strand:+ start:178 stop:666 length:489 start_codon:yes stop_codon:yes gene_type:complete
MTDNKIKPKMTNPIHFMAFCGGTGLIPFAPGTFGSLMGVLLFSWTISINQFNSFSMQLIIAIGLLIAGFWICDASSKALKTHDHPGIVWDEMAAMYAILIFQPMTLKDWVMAFILFRIFDIWKPWPIGFLDKKVTGGIGIMLDDIVAGVATIFACMLLRPYF